MLRNRTMDIFKNVTFVKGVISKTDFPTNNIPHVVFFGKSNVGKSSLINKICNRKSLVKVSKTPGKTRELNFFNLSNKLFLVDCPGYSFAKVSDELRYKWEEVIMYYMEFNQNIKLINILIDAKKGAHKDDILLTQIAKKFNIHTKIVYTKIDKLDNHCISSKNDLVSSDNIIFTSSKTGVGISALRNNIIQVIK